MDKAFPLLRRIHLFKDLPDDDLKELAEQFVPQTYEEGNAVFNQGDVGDAFYVIESGTAEVVVINALSQRKRKLAMLVESDYFGEMALLRHGRRSATVSAQTTLKVWRLSLTDFDKYVAKNPKILPHLSVVRQSRMYARQANFKWLTDNEIVYLVTLRHRVFLLQMLLPPSLTGLGLLIFAGVLLFFKLPTQWVFVPLALFAIDLLWLKWNWEDFHNDWYVVTNKRVVDIDKIALFYDSRAEAPLPTVQNTTIKSTEFGRQLGYGDVIVNTFSGPIVFHDVPNPQATADMILEQVNRARVYQRQMERGLLKNTIRQAIGVDKPPVKPAAADPSTGNKKKQTFGGALLATLKRGLSIRVREQFGDSIIYHKHPYVLLIKVGPVVSAILALVFLLFLFAFEVIPPVIDFLLLFGLVALVCVGLSGWAYYLYIDWKNDVYMVTPTQVVDIEKKPLGAEQRKAANLDAVMNVTFVRPGFLAMLLNYGTVTVQAGPGGEMKFFDVYDPLGVQQDIYRRKEAREAQKAQAAAKQRHEELGQYFSAFYEIMEEERKKRDGGQSSP